MGWCECPTFSTPLDSQSIEHTIPEGWSEWLVWPLDLRFNRDTVTMSNWIAQLQYWRQTIRLQLAKLSGGALVTHFRARVTLLVAAYCDLICLTWRAQPSLFLSYTITYPRTSQLIRRRALIRAPIEQPEGNLALCSIQWCRSFAIHAPGNGAELHFSLRSVSRSGFSNLGGERKK
jgi:hypothetical protein